MDNSAARAPYSNNKVATLRLATNGRSSLTYLSISSCGISSQPCVSARSFARKARDRQVELQNLAVLRCALNVLRHTSQIPILRFTLPCPFVSWCYRCLHCNTNVPQYANGKLLGLADCAIARATLLLAVTSIATLVCVACITRF
jgi:hypothetical protein